MTFDQYRASLAHSKPPAGLSPLLQALWFDAKGDWNQAHQIAQDISSRDGSWVHAFLHRKEGDLSNASYWYHQANRSVPSLSLEQEWESIVGAMLNADH